MLDQNENNSLGSRIKSLGDLFTVAGALTASGTVFTMAAIKADSPAALTTATALAAFAGIALFVKAGSDQKKAVKEIEDLDARMRGRTMGGYGHKRSKMPERSPFTQQQLPRVPGPSFDP